MSDSQDALLEWLRSVGPRSIKDIAAHLEINKQSAWRRVQRLRAPDNKRLRVSEWQRPPDGSPGKFIALYTPGGTDDARRPAWKPTKGNPETRLEYEIRRNAARREARAATRRIRRLTAAAGNPFAQLFVMQS